MFEETSLIVHRHCNCHQMNLILFMQISFLLVYKKYFLLSIPLHQQKMHEKTTKIPLFHPLKRILLPSILLFLSHISSPIFILPEHPKTPYLQCFERKIVQKKNQKEEDICISIKKLSEKNLMPV